MLLLLLDVALALFWHSVEPHFARALLCCAVGGGAAFMLVGLFSGPLFSEPLLALGVFPAAAVAAALAALIGVPFLLARSRGAAGNLKPDSNGS